MSQKIESLLPLVIAAGLLAVAASPLGAGETTGDVRLAGLNVSVGVHGHYGHHVHYRGHFRGHHHYYRPYYWGYYPYRYFYPRVYYGVPRYASRFGALDLNVKPKKTTQVYVDGNYVGLTGDYDGWPEHLWLEKDSYELIFYNPGYETVVRHVEIQPGVVIKIRQDMQPGESTPPEELTTARPKHRAPAPRYQRKAAPEPAPAPRARTAPPPRSEAQAPARPDVLDARQQPARLKLAVAPADASVYLDGRFLGIASEIGEERSGILVDPGEHRLEIVRPGYESRMLSFDAEAGGEVVLEVELRPGAARTSLSA